MSEEDARIVAGVAELKRLFAATAGMLDHLFLVDQEHIRTKLLWVRRHRKDLWGELWPVVRDSWQKHYPNPIEHRRVAAETAQHMHRAWLDRQNRLQRREPRDERHPRHSA